MTNQELTDHFNSLPQKIKEALNSSQTNDLVIKIAKDNGIREDSDVWLIRKLVAQNISGLISIDQFRNEFRGGISELKADKLSELIKQVEDTVINPIKGIFVGSPAVTKESPENKSSIQTETQNKVRAVNIEDIKQIVQTKVGVKEQITKTSPPEHLDLATPVVIQKQASSPKINAFSDISLRSTKGGSNSTEDLISGNKIQKNSKIAAEIEFGKGVTAAAPNPDIKLPEIDRSGLTQFVPNLKDKLPLPPPPLPPQAIPAP